ncbi:hypothetical protein VPH35_130332 [Triticum aestivum]
MDDTYKRIDTRKFTKQRMCKQKQIYYSYDNADASANSDANSLSHYPASRQQGELQGKRKGQDIITPSCPNIICRRCCLRYVLRCSKCTACPIYAFKLNKFHYLRAISCSLYINCIMSIYDYIVCCSCL